MAYLIRARRWRSLCRAHIHLQSHFCDWLTCWCHFTSLWTPSSTCFCAAGGGRACRLPSSECVARPACATPPPPTNPQNTPPQRPPATHPHPNPATSKICSSIAFERTTPDHLPLVLKLICARVGSYTYCSKIQISFSEDDFMQKNTFFKYQGAFLSLISCWSLKYSNKNWLKTDH